MKINVVIPSFYPAVVYGGPIFSSLYLSQELSKNSDVYLHVSTTNTNLTTKLNVVKNRKQKIDGDFFVTYYDETVIGKLSLRLLVCMFTDISKCDLVHVQSIFSTSTPFALLYAKILKKKVLLSPRGQLGAWCMASGSRFKKLWFKYLIKPFAYFVHWHVTSDLEKDEILSLVPNSNVVVIPNGISLEEFQICEPLKKVDFAERFSLPIKADIDKIIVSMGRIQKKKGFDILITAFQAILKRYPNSYLLIAGPDEGEQRKLEILINKLRLNSKVRLVGSLEGAEKNSFLAGADLFALSSHSENFGNVYLESLASGTPVIASTNTPWKHLEVSGCGKCVEATVSDFEEAMLEVLLIDRELTRKKSKALSFQYSWSNIAQQFYKFFKTLE